MILGKKKDDSKQSDEQSDLVKRVDDMMYAKSGKVSELAESFNKQFMGDKPVSNDVKVQSAPVLPKSESTKADPAPPKPAASTPDPQPEPADPEPALDQSDDIKPADEFDDAKTDEAVDDIVAHEGDIVLAVEDAKKTRLQLQAAGPGRRSSLLKNKWLWASLVILLLAALVQAYAVYGYGSL